MSICLCVNDISWTYLIQDLWLGGHITFSLKQQRSLIHRGLPTADMRLNMESTARLSRKCKLMAMLYLWEDIGLMPIKLE